MRLIRPVGKTEVKRAFIVAQYIRKRRDGRYLKTLSEKEFARKLAAAKKYAKGFDDAKLDRAIGKEDATRRDDYNAVRWYLGTVKMREVGVWNGAGGLPFLWTKGSLEETGKKVARALNADPGVLKSRARRAILGILKTSFRAVQEEKYLLPIVLPGGFRKSCRKGSKIFRGDVDDGCMRSIALAVAGQKTMRVYMGIRKKKSGK